MLLKHILLFAFVGSLSMTSCAQNEEDVTPNANKTKEEAPSNPKYDEPHPYGGWFCPDNFGGFPPIDIQNLEKVPVVSGRLPTKEEAGNGTSLMYFDPDKYPNAQALDMPLPRVATIFSRHNGMTEYVIVIQAVAVGEDTVVGFRYPNGGNGTAWMGQVNFLTEEERKEIGPAPFVYFNTPINASKAAIWKAICKTKFARELSKKYNEKAFFNAPWTPESKVHLNYESGQERATGIIADFWSNLFLHIDSELNGFHFSQKLMVMESGDGKGSQLHFVAGPYPKDFGVQQVLWNNWVQEVKTLAEGK